MEYGIYATSHVTQIIKLELDGMLRLLLQLRKRILTPVIFKLSTLALIPMFRVVIRARISRITPIKLKNIAENGAPSFISKILILMIQSSRSTI